MPRWHSDQADKVESLKTEAEIRKVISLMKNGKLPGCDGFPPEYYKEYVDIIAPVLQQVLWEASEKGHVPPTFKKALISLMPEDEWKIGTWKIPVISDLLVA